MTQNEPGVVEPFGPGTDGGVGVTTGVFGVGIGSDPAAPANGSLLFRFPEKRLSWLSFAANE